MAINNIGTIQGNGTISIDLNNTGTINNVGTIQGNGTIYDDLNNNGIVNVQTAYCEIDANLLSNTGTGQVNIGTGGTLQLDKAASGNTITFSDATGVLTFEQIGSIANTVTITGLQAGDLIQIPNVPPGFTEVFNAGTVVISNAGTTLGSLVFGGTLPSATVVQNALVLCFVSGTRIATPDGVRPVEALKIGDRVRLHDGGADEIQWVGRRQVDCQRHPKPVKVRPFRIVAHAFRRGVPNRDLLLSPDHAVFVDGVLIPVKYLDNGTTIRQMKVDKVTYHHLELRDHAIIQAEGLSVETLLPGSDKTAFATDRNVFRLHADFSIPNWDAMGCAELVVFGPRLDAVRRRLGRRAAAIDAWRLRRAS